MSEYETTMRSRITSNITPFFVFISTAILMIGQIYHFNKWDMKSDMKMQQLKAELELKTDEIERREDINNRWIEFFKINPELNVPPGIKIRNEK
jgi:hypothetical protein